MFRWKQKTWVSLERGAILIRETVLNAQKDPNVMELFCQSVNQRVNHWVNYSVLSQPVNQIDNLSQSGKYEWIVDQSVGGKAMQILSK
jgi:hypothetical protein